MNGDDVLLAEDHAQQAVLLIAEKMQEAGFKVMDEKPKGLLVEYQGIRLMIGLQECK